MPWQNHDILMAPQQINPEKSNALVEWGGTALAAPIALTGCGNCKFPGAISENGADFFLFSKVGLSKSTEEPFNDIQLYYLCLQLCNLLTPHHLISTQPHLLSNSLPLRLTSMEWAKAPPEAPTTSPLTFFSFLSKVPPPLMRESRRSSADWGGCGRGLSAFFRGSASGVGLAGAVWVVDVLLVDRTDARGELGLDTLGSGVASNVVSTVALVVEGLSLPSED